MDTSVDAERDPCVEYPVVLNHTSVPTNSDAIRRPPFRRSKGRKGARFGTRSTAGMLRLDNLDGCGQLYVSLKQRGMQNMSEERNNGIRRITDRIFVRISEGYESIWGPDRLFLADLPRPRYEDSRDLQSDLLDFEEIRNKTHR